MKQKLLSLGLSLALVLGLAAGCAPKAGPEESPRRRPRRRRRRARPRWPSPQPLRAWRSAWACSTAPLAWERPSCSPTATRGDGQPL